MSSKIPNLWPIETVSVEILPPLVILRIQAENLTQMMHGLLQGEITTEVTDKGIVQHHFDIVAPALNSYRHRLFSVTHDENLVYPVSHNAPFDGDIHHAISEVHGIYTNEANTENDFLIALKEIFRTRRVLSVINSLVARSNEAQLKNEQSAAKELQAA